MSNLSDFLTIIITTSPIKSHPSTYILDQVIESFNFIDGLNDCKKIIICDDYKIISNNIVILQHFCTKILVQKCCKITTQ